MSVKNALGYLFILLFPCSLLAAPVLSQQEKLWIKEHPVVPYIFIDAWPVDYQVNGRHVGLMRDYLDAITKDTGIRFQPVYPDRSGHYATPPMMISAIAANLATANTRKDWLFTSLLTRSSTMVVTQANRPNIFSLTQLAGKRIAIRDNSFYEHWLRNNELNIQVETYSDIREALLKVEQGKIYAALGTELSMRPLQQRFFPASLGIAGVLSESTADIAMAVRREDPVLLSIVNKSLQALTARQTDLIYARWIDELDLGSPPLRTILYYYRNELLAFGALFIVLMIALRSAILSRRRAQCSEMEKSRFLAVMSHEIRTPMNSVMASLELLQTSKEANERHEYIEIAHASASQLLELLDNVLDHSRLESDGMTLSAGVFALAPFIDSIMATHQAQAQRKTLALTCKMAPVLREMWIIADAQRLSQILNNLLSNALKFTERGSVTLRLTRQEHDNEHIMLQMAVTDTGPGIPLQAQADLFQAWKQVNRDTLGGQSGSGLGLYICHELAQLMNGDLQLSSQPGQGTTLTLQVPVTLTQPSSGTVAPEEAVLPRFRAGTAVLVVEDHPVNQILLRAQLEKMGCEITLAQTGQQALTLIAEENYFDMVLLDCNLPDMDGYQVARKLRELETRQEREAMPVIAISALSDAAHRQRCHDSGMSDVLTKPVNLAALSAMLLTWCSEAVIQQQAVATEIEAPSRDELNVSLKDDLRQLRTAIAAGDRRYMRHYTHRIRGVAQMHGLQALALQAAAFEESLLKQTIQSREMDLAILSGLEIALADSLGKMPQILARCGQGYTEKNPKHI
jgi:two-component system sensor histidine kinase EvgS